MALFHLSVTQTKRSAGQSAIASAAYRAGERLYSEYYGEYSDYTRKGGVICSDILLPSHAPPEFADRQTLWNAVEKAERGKNAQLAYANITELDAATLNRLIKEIVVHSGGGFRRGQRDGADCKGHTGTACCSAAAVRNRHPDPGCAVCRGCNF